MTEQTTAPRVTPADIEAQIVDERYFTAEDGVLGAHLHCMPPTISQPLKLLTFCVLVLRNGFTVTGESACASPELFSAELGRRIARQHAVEKVWPLLGYELRTKLKRLDEIDAASAVFDAQPVPKGGRIVWHEGCWSDGSSADAPLETSEAGARPYPKAPDA